MGITVNIWGVSMYTVYLFMLIILCIYSNEKVFICCKCICVYSYGAFYN